jgi:hypothetical protein
LAWGYTWTGNLDVDVIGAADSLAGDFMLVVMPIVVVVIIVVLFLFLLSAWIGVGVGYELLEEGDNRAMTQKESKKISYTVNLKPKWEGKEEEEMRYRVKGNLRALRRRR